MQGLLDEYYKAKKAFRAVATSFEEVLGPRREIFKTSKLLA